MMKITDCSTPVKGYVMGWVDRDGLSEAETRVHGCQISFLFVFFGFFQVLSNPEFYDPADQIKR